MVVAAFVALAALIVLGAAMVLTGRWDPGLAGDERPGPPQLPPGPWEAAAVESLRFRVGLRGYRMEDVDAALAAIAADLRARSDPGSTADDQPAEPASGSAG